MTRFLNLCSPRWLVPPTLALAAAADLANAQTTISYADGQIDSSTTVLDSSASSLTLQVDEGTATRSGIIGEAAVAGKLIKSGAGTLWLTSPFNQYSGGTILQGGTLIAQSEANLGHVGGYAGSGGGGVTFAGGNLLFIGFEPTTVNLALTVNSPGRWSAAAGTTVNYGGTITGGGLTLGGAGAFGDGAFVFSSSARATGRKGADGNNDAGFPSNGVDGENALTISEGFSFENSGTITGGRGGNSAFSPNIVRSGGKGGTGLIISGSELTNRGTIAGGNGGVAIATTNPISGVVTPPAMGAGGSGLVASDSVVSNYGTISAGLRGDDITRGDAIVFTGSNNTLIFQEGSTIVGNVDVTGLLNVDVEAASTSIQGGFNGSGTLLKWGLGTLTLQEGSSITGPTSISEGALILGGDLASSSVTLTGSGAVLGVTGTGIKKINNFSGLSSSSLLLDGASLAAGGADSTTYAGSISGTGGFIKQGSGTTTLTGSRTYTGVTGVHGGVLQINDLGQSTSLSFANGGTLETSTDITFNGPGSSTGGGRWAAATGTTITYGGTMMGGLTLGSETRQGSFVFTPSASVRGQDGAAGTITATSNPITGTRYSDPTDGAEGQAALTWASGVLFSNAGSLRGGNGGNGGGAAALQGSSGGRGGVGFSLSNTTFTNNGSITGGDAGTSYAPLPPFLGLPVSAATIVPGGSGIVASDTTLINSGTITGGLANNGVRSSAITFSGTNTLTLLGSGSIVGAIDVTGTLILQQPTDHVLGSGIIGTGSVVKEGAGVLRLNGLSTYSGSTTINDGILSLGPDGGLTGTSGVTLAKAGAGLGVYGGGMRTISNFSSVAGTVLDLDGANLALVISGSMNYDGTVRGTGGFIKAGSGTLTLTGSRTYTGATGVRDGIFQLGSLGSSSSLILDGGTLRTGTSLTFNGPIAANGGAWATATGTTVQYGGSAAGGVVLGDTSSDYRGAFVFGESTAVTAGAGADGYIVYSGTGTFVPAVGAVWASAGQTAVTLQSGIELTHAGVSIGGVGGKGANFFFYTAQAGGGGTGIAAKAGARLVNSGQIAGGNGGVGASGDFADAGGAGGAGVTIETGGSFINQESVRGGVGGLAGIGTSSNSGARGGTGGSGVAVGDSASFTNHGLVTGNTGGQGQVAIGGLGGAGAILANGAQLQNTGTITGGNAGALSVVVAAPPGLVTGGSGLYVSGNATIRNSGTIAGGLNRDGSQAPSITFASGDSTLILEAGSNLTGNIDVSGSVAFAPATAQTLNNVITGSGAVLVAGPGALTLTGASTYTGATTVNAGTLLVNGSLASALTTVKSGGTLGGSGSLRDLTLESGGFLSPGNSVGILAAASFTWSGGGTLVFELGAGGASDVLDLSGDLTKGGAGAFRFTFQDAGWAEGQTYTLITFAGSTDFTASDFSFTNGGGFNGNFAVKGNSVQFTPVAVPEPSTCALGFVALFGGAILVLRPRFLRRK